MGGAIVRGARGAARHGTLLIMILLTDVNSAGVTSHLFGDDLGRSGAGAARLSFEKLLATIWAGRLCNGRDWHTLLELCGRVGTLIINEEGVCDPGSINDRLLLGIKAR